MARMIIGAAALMLALGGVAACESDEGNVDRCTKHTYEGKINEQGKKIGEPCQSNDECMYGLCYGNSVLNGGASGFCTKDCGCGKDDTHKCAMDNPVGSDFVYVCYRPPISGTNIDNLGSYCVPRCKSVGDADSVVNWCQALNPDLDTCQNPPVGNPEPLCTSGL
jgi:hypothetical protein